MVELDYFLSPTCFTPSDAACSQPVVRVPPVVREVLFGGTRDIFSTLNFKIIIIKPAGSVLLEYSSTVFRKNTM